MSLRRLFGVFASQSYPSRLIKKLVHQNEGEDTMEGLSQLSQSEESGEVNTSIDLFGSTVLSNHKNWLIPLLDFAPIASTMFHAIIFSLFIQNRGRFFHARKLVSVYFNDL
jgi:hypothetical protein